MKEGLSSFDVTVLLTELRQLIIGARIDNIYQINPNLLLFRIRKTGQQTLDLLLEAGKRFNLTSYKLSIPKRPPSFCMALRKYLRNGKILDITQHKFDRIIVLKASTSRGEYALEVEFFGNGNMILMDQNKIILQALHYRRMKDREIIRGVEFAFPPSIGLDPRYIDRSDLDALRELQNMSVVRGLTRLLSLGGVYAEEILLRASLEKNRPCKTLSVEELDRIYSSILELVKSIDNPQPGIIINEEGEWIDVVPFSLKIYSTFEVKHYSSFNEAVDEYYVRAATEVSGGKFEERERELSRLRRILEEQKEKKEKLEREISFKNRIGGVIYRHINQLTFLLQRIKDRLSEGTPPDETLKELRKESDALLPGGSILSINSKLKTVTVNLEGETFQLDLKESVQNCAERYYDEAKKAKRKLEGLLEAIRETKDRMRSFKIELEERKAPLELIRRRRRAWYEKYRWFRSSEGFLVLGGRDATTNEILIKKHMEPHDIVLHADIQGAPFVLIKTEGKAPSESTIREAGQLAASYSKAWKEGFHAVDVYWVRPEQIDKKAPSGQYIKKGAFMMRGKKNYLHGMSLEVSIGLKIEDGEVKFIGGPTEAISKETEYAVRLTPGRLKSGSLAKLVRERLARMVPEKFKEAVLRAPLEEIQAFIPPGGGEIS